MTSPQYTLRRRAYADAGTAIRSAELLEAQILTGNERRPGAVHMLRGYKARFLAGVYGVHPNWVGHFVSPTGAIGLPEPRGPERSVWSYLSDFTPAVEHIITDGWNGSIAAVDRFGSDKSAESVINRELRGISRVLWLACLWMGLDVRDIRPDWYHWSELDQQVWVAAYDCTRIEGALEDLIRYGRGLVWRRAEIQALRFTRDGKPAKVPRTHKALEYLNNAEALWAQE